MITLSSTLTAAQKTLTYEPIWKIILSRTSQTTKGYDNTRIMSISYSEQPDSYKADVTLDNSDSTLTTLDFEHYQMVYSRGCATGVARSAWVAGTAYAVDDIRIPVTANGFQYRCSVAGTSHASTEPTWPTDLGVTVTDGTVTWEMDGNTGDEYVRRAPMRVRSQVLISDRGRLTCTLQAVGLIDQLREELARARYVNVKGDTNTLETIIDAICEGSAATPWLFGAAALHDCFWGYQVVTVVYDSVDGIINTFKLEDDLKVNINDSRWGKIQEMLDYTGCKWRVGNDNKLHILDPVTTGTTYDYEYKFDVDGEHSFFSRTTRQRFVQPNYETVASYQDDGEQHLGFAYSTTSEALNSLGHITMANLTGKAGTTAALIAAAIIERRELDAEKGFATVPMNFGTELWDYVKITDSRQNDTRVGNIQYISEHINVRSRVPIYQTIAFGRVTAESLARASMGALGPLENARMSNEQIMALIETIHVSLEQLYAWNNELEDNIYAISYTIAALLVYALFKHVDVLDSLVIPVSI